MALGNPYGAMARCVLNPDKTVDYFLDINDSNKKMDGTAVDWTEVENSGQNVMVQIPKFYYCKKWDDTAQAFYFGVSSVKKETDFVKIDEWVVHPAFIKDQTKLCDATDHNPVEVPYRYISAFIGWIDGSGRLRSLPNKPAAAATYIDNARAVAKAMGAGYCLMDYYLYYAIQMLYLTEYNSPNSRKYIGYGTSVFTNSGATLNKGNNTYGITTGVVADNTGVTSYRGIENVVSVYNTWIDNVVNAFSKSGYRAFYATNKGCVYDASYTKISSDISNVEFAKSGVIRTIEPSADSGFLPISLSANNESGLYSGYRVSSGTCGFSSGSYLTWGASSIYGYNIVCGLGTTPDSANMGIFGVFVNPYTSANTESASGRDALYYRLAL